MDALKLNQENPKANEGKYCAVDDLSEKFSCHVPVFTQSKQKEGISIF